MSLCTTCCNGSLRAFLATHKNATSVVNGLVKQAHNLDWAVVLAERHFSDLAYNAYGHRLIVQLFSHHIEPPLGLCSCIEKDFGRCAFLLDLRPSLAGLISSLGFDSSTPPAIWQRRRFFFKSAHEVGL